MRVMFLSQAMLMAGHWDHWEVAGRSSRAPRNHHRDIQLGITHEDHENGAVSTSEGGVVSCLACCLAKVSLVHVPIRVVSTWQYVNICAFNERRCSSFFSTTGNVVISLFPLQVPGLTCKCVQLGDGSIEEIRKASLMLRTTYARAEINARIFWKGQWNVVEK